MKEQVLSREQMQELIDMGIDTSNASCMKITDKFEYELWKRLESKYYDIVKRLKNDINNGNDEDRFVIGEYVAYHVVWNNIYDRYFHVCKKLGRLDEFYALRDLRIED